MSKEVFYIDDDIVLATEYLNEDVVLAHCSVSKWSLSVLRKLYKQWGKLTNEKHIEGYKYIDTLSPNNKFCEMAGFAYMGLDFDHEGKIHSHYRYSLGE